VAGRATDFFGPGVSVSALGERFWPALLSGKPVDWVGNPDAPHSFAYLPDLAAAYVALANTPSA
jgi:nucleoside-diphosphate-sugar epimerase